MADGTDLERLEKIAEGREAEVFAWGDGRIVRLLREAGPEERLDAERAGLAAAAAAGVRVPAVFGSVMVEGRPGLILERIHGPDLLTRMGDRPWTTWKAGQQTGDIHARINRAEAPASLPSARAAAATALDALRPHEPALFGWVESILEALPDGDRLCHGDFHPGQLLMDGRSPVVIDWTNAKRGDPVYDYARTRMMIAIGEPPGEVPQPLRTFMRVARGLFMRAYERSYAWRAGAPDRGRARRWEIVCLAQRLLEGIPGEREVLESTLRREFARATRGRA